MSNVWIQMRQLGLHSNGLQRLSANGTRSKVLNKYVLVHIEATGQIYGLSLHHIVDLCTTAAKAWMRLADVLACLSLGCSLM